MWCILVVSCWLEVLVIRGRPLSTLVWELKCLLPSVVFVICVTPVVFISIVIVVSYILVVSIIFCLGICWSCWFDFGLRGHENVA